MRATRVPCLITLRPVAFNLARVGAGGGGPGARENIVSSGRYFVSELAQGAVWEGAPL